jgi:hypothetical protein
MIFSYSQKALLRSATTFVAAALRAAPAVRFVPPHASRFTHHEPEVR